MKKYVISIWKDVDWHSAFRKSWKKRRYWLTKYEIPTTRGKGFALQFMDYTIKILIMRNEDG